MAERTYGEHEIKALLERAAQLQAMVGGDPTSDTGLTLAELEDIAAEAGIDPAFLRAAAREAETGPAPRTVAGQTKTHVFVERTVPGSLSDTEWEAAVLRLRQQFSSDLVTAFGGGPQYGPGIAEALGTTREWRHTTSLGVATTVTIRSVEGMQHLRIQRRVGLGSPRVEGISYGALLALLFSGIGIAVLSAPVLFVPLMIALFLLTFPLIELLDRRWRKQKLAEIQEVADDIAGIIRNAEPEEEETRAITEETRGVEAIAPATPSSHARLLDLDALPDVDEVELRRHKANRAKTP